MRGTKAKRLRREQVGPPPPKQFTKPFTVPLPRGKVDPKTGKQALVETYIPRFQRRKIMRKMMTDIRKGRFDFSKLKKPEGAIDDRQPGTE